jgi:type IV secretory pathway TraG/TraD family ATPase VirD4
MFTAKNLINFQKLRDEKTVLFFSIPEQKIPYYAFLLNLFYKQFFEFTMSDINNTNLPIYCLLDEFGNMKLPNFDTTITVIRKY